jgi:hypothetical protein
MEALAQADLRRGDAACDSLASGDGVAIKCLTATDEIATSTILGSN